MSYIGDLVEDYRRFVQLPWPSHLAPAQRVWMVVYRPEEERRLRLHIEDFEIESRKAGYEWDLVDISDEFERWMGSHEYREAYFRNPELMQPELVSFFDQLADGVREQVEEKAIDQTIIGLLGAASLYGLGDHVKVSALIERVQEAVQGRLLVFFPGEVEGNSYRLLGARDGWNYLATRITVQKG